jgi:hypothetical protein
VSKEFWPEILGLKHAAMASRFQQEGRAEAVWPSPSRLNPGVSIHPNGNAFLKSENFGGPESPGLISLAVGSLAIVYGGVSLERFGLPGWARRGQNATEYGHLFSE